MPFALLLGLRRESIGATFSIAREPNIAIISDMYGLDTPEGRGVMGVYVAGTVLVPFSSVYLQDLRLRFYLFIPMPWLWQVVWVVQV